MEKINKTNYHLNTKAIFTQIEEKNIDFSKFTKIYSSTSGSEYWQSLDETTLIRKSDHWMNDGIESISTCEWWLNNTKNTYDAKIGTSVRFGVIKYSKMDFIKTIEQVQLEIKKLKEKLQNFWKTW